MKTLKVKNFISPRSGREIANKFLIETNDGTFFQSYNVIVAQEVWNRDVVIDPEYLDYSKTTNKYLYEFLNMGRKEINEGIKSGTIQLIKLN